MEVVLRSAGGRVGKLTKRKDQAWEGRVDAGKTRKIAGWVGMVEGGEEKGAKKRKRQRKKKAP